MNRLLIRYLLTALIAYGIIASSLGGSLDNSPSILYFIFALFILDMIVRPIFYVLGLVFSVVTAGLFVFVIQAWILMLADLMVPGIDLGGFLPAIIIAVLVYLVMEMLPEQHLQIQS